MRVVLATSNLHKVDEMRAILTRPRGGGGLGGLAGVELVGLRDLPNAGALREPAETGSTFEQNATIKALSYARQTGLVCLADDSGLEIDALGGHPGVISSHYCTDGREEGMTRPQRDAANNQRVLRELEGVRAEQRGARFVCVMVLAGPGSFSPLHQSRGTFEGRIGMLGDVPRGENGFGYDPLFLVGAEPYFFSVTSAELSTEEKNRLSHRGAAAREMSEFLRTLRA